MSLATVGTTPVPAHLRDVVDRAREFKTASRAPSTLTAYAKDWRLFADWCARQGVASFPADPAVVAVYLAEHAGTLAVATLQRRLTSITYQHTAAGLEPPTRNRDVQEVWAGIRRTFGTAQYGKAPARTALVREMVETLDLGTLSGARNRALLVIGFAGALRRSELVALDVDDVTETEHGLNVLLRRSKTDQEGKGAVLGLPYGSDPVTCPVRSLRAWYAASGISSGAIFRTVKNERLSERRLQGRAVADVVKKTVAAAGHDPGPYSGHSLRAGLITSAAENGVADRDICRHSRHASVAMMEKYVRGARVWEKNAAAAVGL